MAIKWLKSKIYSLRKEHGLELKLVAQPIHLGLINNPEKWNEYNHFTKVINGVKVELGIHDMEVCING